MEVSSILLADLLLADPGDLARFLGVLGPEDGGSDVLEVGTVEALPLRATSLRAVDLRAMDLQTVERLEGAVRQLQFQTLRSINLYDSPACDRLATQGLEGRYVRLQISPLQVPPLERKERSLEHNLSLPSNQDLSMVLLQEQQAIGVVLVEDDYPGWLSLADAGALVVARQPYQAIAVTRAEIESRLGAVVAFTQAAMLVPNQYLWGGTVAPFYDCSGLMQAAFRSQGVWLPRDAYQQETFVEPLVLDRERLATGDWQGLRPGDLVFFGTPEKATHVGLYLGEGRYIHSSGREVGRNGIGVDVLSGGEAVPAVSQRYFQQFRGGGRVVCSYRPI